MNKREMSISKFSPIRVFSIRFHNLLLSQQGLQNGQEIEETELKVIGEIPHWLEGSLFRNGTLL
jgi:hypothetical protein